jgi:hypothetical protein
MAKDKFLKIGGLDERAHSMFEEIELGAKCIDQNWHCIVIPFPEVPHIGSVTWNHAGPKAAEKERRYNEASELLQNEYWGRNWSLHRKWEQFVMTQQPVEGKPFGVQTIELEDKDETGETIRRWKKRIRVPLLLYENALRLGTIIPNYYDDILEEYIAGVRKWDGFKIEEAQTCLFKTDNL